MAPWIWWSALIVVVLLALAVGACDFGLYLHGMPTISAWLRLHPGWFWWPVIVLDVGLLLLAVHLFAKPRYFPDLY
jgi:hypothetical protein